MLSKFIYEQAHTDNLRAYNQGKISLEDMLKNIKAIKEDFNKYYPNQNYKYKD